MNDSGVDNRPTNSNGLPCGHGKPSCTSANWMSHDALAAASLVMFSTDPADGRFVICPRWRLTSAASLDTTA